MHAGPAAAGRVLGERLRQLREQRGLKLTDVAPQVSISAATLSRLERGLHPPKERNVVALLRFYRVSDHELDVMRQLLVQAEKKEWWHQFNDVLPGWMHRLVATESASTEIRTYHCQYVPGLAQTPDYARAVVSMAFSNPQEASRAIQRKVEVRLQRQQILHQHEPPLYSALLDEAILHRQLGSRQMFRGQLRHLLTLAEDFEQVNIRIVPFRSGAAGMAPAPAVTYLKFAQGGTQELIYLEQHPTGGQYLSAPDVIEEYRRALMDLTGAAANRVETVRMLEDAIDRLKD
jgi:transcriptional regulator with XRE-family HTH domain